MNTKILKQKILDLAIRGKLTQQLKSDGTAADLLKQISEQKRESSSTLSSSRRRGSPSAQSEKTIIPLDKSEAPFEIPANWEWVRLGDIISIKSGDAIKVRNNQIGEFPVYGGNGVTGYCDSFNIEKETIVIGRVGFNCGSVHISKGKAWVTDNAFVAKFDDAIYDISFLEKLLIYFNLRQYSNSTAQPVISGKTIYPIPIPLPPLTEQQRIVEKIQEAFAEIDSIENNKELLKTHIKQARQKILDLAIHGKLVPQNKTDEPASVLLERITRDNPHYEKLTDVPFEIPNSWEWTRLGDVCHFIGGGTPDKSNLKYWNGSINWASVKDIKGLELTDTVDKITEAGFKESAASYAEKEDLILVTRINPGMCVQTKIKTAINQDLKVVKVPSQINKIYVIFFCNYAQKWFLEKSSGTTVKGIKIDAVLQMPFPLPPLAEQKRIVDRIEEIFKSLDEISLHLV